MRMYMLFMRTLSKWKAVRFVVLLESKMHFSLLGRFSGYIFFDALETVKLKFVFRSKVHARDERKINECFSIERNTHP